MLRVKLLGELTLEVDGRRMELPASRRARSLLGLLALERRTHPRGQLAARFWPDVLDESARTSLRSALSALRRALGADADRYLLATREAVALAGPEEVWTDVGEFERLVAAGRLEDALAAVAWRSARGPRRRLGVRATRGAPRTAASRCSSGWPAPRRPPGISRRRSRSRAGRRRSTRSPRRPTAS